MNDSKHEKQLILYDHHDWQVILFDSKENKAVLYNVVNQDIVICEGALQSSHIKIQQQPFITKHAGSATSPSKCPLCKQVLSPKMKRNSTDPTDSVPVVPTHTASDIELDESYMSRDYFALLEYRLEKEKQDSQSPRNDGPYASDPLGTSSLNSGYYKKFFVEEKKIGSGGFGAVYLCRHVINGVDLGKYAIKKVPVGDNRPWLMKVLREVKALVTLKKHPNIVNYQHSWLETDKTADFGPSVPCLLILMEYANGGSLADMIGSSRNALREQEVWKYFLDICEGLNHLHSCGIIHRDIKPQNILLSTTSIRDSVDTRLLISDFGTCTTKMREPSVKRTGNTGTMEYIAPELLVKDQNGLYNEYFDEKCDIWSLGVILYEMAFGKLPFASSSINVEELISEIVSLSDLHIPTTHTRSHELLDMIHLLLKTNPNERPTTSEILKSSVLKKYRRRREAKIVRIPSVDNLSNLDKPGKDLVGTVVSGLRRSKEHLSTDRRLSLSSSSLPVPRPLKPSLTLMEYAKYFVQPTFVMLLLIKLWMCLTSCEAPAAPSPTGIYPLVLASVAQILLSDSRNYDKYVYLLSIMQWLWIALLSYFDSFCLLGQTSVTPHLSTYNNTILILSVITTYLSRQLQ